MKNHQFEVGDKVRHHHFIETRGEITEKIWFNTETEEEFSEPGPDRSPWYRIAWESGYEHDFDGNLQAVSARPGFEPEVALFKSTREVDHVADGFLLTILNTTNHPGYKEFLAKVQNEPERGID